MSAETPPTQTLGLWRSLDEPSPEAGPEPAAEFAGAFQPGAVDRRAALRLMAASLALATAAGCSNGEAPEGRPQLSPPRGTPGVAPGTALRFATVLDHHGMGRGVLVKSQDGRPVKIEGNPLHPASLGATDAWLEAEILSLYDPDRSNEARNNSRRAGWDEVSRLIAELGRDPGRGRGLHLLLPHCASPTLDRLGEAVRRRLPLSRFHFHSPLESGAAAEGAALAFGRPLDTLYRLEDADLVVAIGGDLFSTEAASLAHAKGFAARLRQEDRAPPRLVAVEATPSLFGARAAERVVLRQREIEGFALALAASVGALPGGPEADESAHPAARRLAAALRSAGPRGVVAVGREQPACVQALAHAVNARIGSIVARHVDPVLPPSEPDRSIAALAEAIAAGRVSRLLVLGANPAFDAPADLDLRRLLPTVPVSLHLGSHRDETAALCRWHAPRAHPLEGFGDLLAFDGTAGLRQPAVVPLRPGLSTEDALALLAGGPRRGRALVEETWGGRLGPEGFDAALEAGLVAGTARPAVPAALREGWERGLPPPAARPSAPLDILFRPDPSVWDGRYGNNGWLQELPKPLTKQVWGNAALIAPATAARFGLATGDAVEVSAAGGKVSLPVWLMPGQAEDTLTLTLGHGRWRAGAIGTGIGFDTYPLRASMAPWTTAGTLRPTGGREALVSTQAHHRMTGEAVRVVASGERAEAMPPAAQPSFYPPWPSEGHAWAMAIDLDACIGCNACAVACQSENNVAVVGPEQVALGREMHWLRIDRYYAGEPAVPETFFQPVPCMQCEAAPCEVVCPVNATVHSAEGLNDMVYNRCIGTRTCSNNCPYKVRRFNFVDYALSDYAVPADALNPQVTVRDRGVMEKCTYCTQRISAARIAAGIENRALRDGDVVTACQSACPTEAITFGDVNDPESRVARLKASPRNYALLGGLNTRPRTTYLARIRAEEAS